VEPGDVKVLGGRRGYADLRAAEPVDVLFNPRESGAVTVRIFTVRGRLVREQTVPSPRGCRPASPGTARTRTAAGLPPACTLCG